MSASATCLDDDGVACGGTVDAGAVTALIGEGWGCCSPHSSPDGGSG